MNTVTESANTVNADRALWVTTVRRVSELAQAKLPEALHGRIQRGTALVLSGAVWFEDDGRTCQVRASDGQSWYLVNGTCPCEDAQHAAPDGMCKHRFAKGIYRRAAAEPYEPAPLPLDPEALTPAPQATAVPAQYVVMIQGKPFVRFAGLLALAHERGLVELAASWTYNDAGLSLAEAIATFSDGRRFEECGDATADNVTRTVAAHFRRVALTRAKARVLRDALGIDLCAVEELGED